MSEQPGYRRATTADVRCGECAHAHWRERTHRWVCIAAGVGHSPGFCVGAFYTCSSALLRRHASDQGPPRA
jgi:hypothetical protein